jgi:hypothetical protein
MVEFDLDNGAVPTPLNFLSYDWRGGVGELDDYDEMLDGTYTDNPRATIVFGGYRGHDSVIDRHRSLTTHG